MNKVLIVIMLFNRQPYTKICLENLFAYTAESFDLLLWDNGSQAPIQRLLDEVEKIKLPNKSNITIVRCKNNLGVGTTLHYAQKYRKPGQHMMQLDSDIIVPKDSNWLTDLIHIIEHNNDNIQLVGYPQYNPVHFYNTYPDREIVVSDKRMIIHDATDMLGCCFIGHSNFFDKFQYPIAEKRIGEGCDISVCKYARQNNIKMAYIRPASMIEFLEAKFHCIESAEYHQWKLKTLYESEYNEDFIPTQVSDDPSNFNMDFYYFKH